MDSSALGGIVLLIIVGGFIFFSWIFFTFVFVFLILAIVFVIVRVINGEWASLFYLLIIIPGLYYTFPIFLSSVQILIRM